MRRSQSQGSEARKPWYQQARVVIVGAGALAAAVLSVVTLVRVLLPADEADVGVITSAEVVRVQTLGDFAASIPGLELPLTPSEAAGLDLLDRTQLVADSRLLPTANPLERRPAATPTVTPRTTPAPTATPSPPAQRVPEPSPTAERTATSDPIAPPTPGETPEGFEDQDLLRLARVWPPPDEFLVELAGDPDLAELIDEPSDLRTVSMHAVMDVRVDPTSGGSTDTLVSAEQVAKALVAALSEVESQARADGGVDPLGWVVAVNVDVQGLAGVPLLLTWSLDSVDTEVPMCWAADTIAYRLTATTPHDTGSVEVWVPDLASPSAYNVNLKLLNEPSGSVLARHAVPLPGE